MGSTGHMQALMERFDAAESQIKQNNAGIAANAEKDRLRAKQLRSQMDEMLSDYNTNVRVDPEEMSQAVKQGVEVALLRMTEKKMKAEMELARAKQTISEQSKRIAELELLVRTLQTQRAQSIAIVQSNELTVDYEGATIFVDES